MTRALVIGLWLGCVLDASPADACVCAPPRAACSQFWHVKAAFAGRVTQITPVADRPGMLAVRFAVDRQGQGVDSDTVVVESAPQDGSNCGYTFRVGESYVVYAFSSPDGRLATNMCSGTKLAKDAAADLAFLEEVAGPPRGVRIFGQVRRVEYDFVSRSARDFGGVAGAHVEVTGDRASREGTTGQDGNYDFSDLPPGRYTVAVTPPPGLVLAGPSSPAEQRPPPSTVTLTHPSECAEMWTWPRTDSQISGILVNSDGSAVDEELVDLIAASNARRDDKEIPHVSVRTAVDGRFTFAFIPPGSYLVGVNLKNPPPASELDRRSYYPGVTNPGAATVVTIGTGSTRIELSPFTLPDWPLERRLSGAVMWSDGVPAADAMVTLLGAASDRVPLDSAGRFTLTLPYGAQFWVNARASRTVNGVRVSGSSMHTIGRNDRDSELSLILKLPR